MILAIKSVFKLVCGLGTVVALSSVAPDYHLQLLRNKVAPSVFIVLNSNGSGGTGFSIAGKSGNKYILTNKHVCGLSPEDGSVHEVGILQDDTFYKRPVIAVDKDHDLCLVDSVSDEIDVIEMGSPVDIGDHIAIIGYPLLSPLQVSKGVYNGYTAQMRLSFLLPLQLPIAVPVGWTSAASYPGNSGSPVVNFYGELVGVLFAGAGDHVNMIVPLRSIERFLKQH